LSKTYRLSTSDGRTFEGVFICIDRERNIILQDALESTEQEPDLQREVGMVRLPDRCMVVSSKADASEGTVELTSFSPTDHGPVEVGRQG
jgi:small nuclear ribonucleoprotein (snRNP)-like protein